MDERRVGCCLGPVSHAEAAAPVRQARHDAPVAVTHLDRLRKGLDLLGAGLAPFVDKHMSAAAPADWADLLAARDEQRSGRRTAISKTDPAVLLRCLTEEWRAFGGTLSRLDQSFASELRDIRKRVAHPDERAPLSS